MSDLDELLPSSFRVLNVNWRTSPSPPCDTGLFYSTVLEYRVRKYTACSVHCTEEKPVAGPTISFMRSCVSVCMSSTDVCYCNQWLTKQQTILFVFPLVWIACLKDASSFKFKFVGCTSGGLNPEFSSRYILNRFTSLHFIQRILNYL
jgi:hypothetical protein